MRALLAVTFCSVPFPTPRPATAATERSLLPLVQRERGPERWGSLPGSHSMNWAELGQGYQPDGAGEGGWQWVGAMDEAGGFSNNPSKLHGLTA